MYIRTDLHIQEIRLVHTFCLPISARRTLKIFLLLCSEGLEAEVRDRYM